MGNVNMCMRLPVYRIPTPIHNSISSAKPKQLQQQKCSTMVFCPFKLSCDYCRCIVLWFFPPSPYLLIASITHLVSIGFCKCIARSERLMLISNYHFKFPISDRPKLKNWENKYNNLPFLLRINLCDRHMNMFV